MTLHQYHKSILFILCIGQIQFNHRCCSSACQCKYDCIHIYNQFLMQVQGRRDLVGQENGTWRLQGRYTVCSLSFPTRIWLAPAHVSPGCPSGAAVVILPGNSSGVVTHPTSLICSKREEVDQSHWPPQRPQEILLRFNYMLPVLRTLIWYSNWAQQNFSFLC